MTRMLFKHALLALFLPIALNAPQAFAEGVGSDLWLASAEGQLAVDFVNDGEVSALQFDVSLPGPLMESRIECGSAAVLEMHQVVCEPNKDEGFVRVLVFAIPTAEVPDGEIVRIYSVESAALGQGASRQLESSSGGEASTVMPVELRNINLVDAEGVTITPAHLK